ncbi:filamentous hemagglutinin N-terminal domain-containing protein [Phenylobacterium sp.]|uniref:two-partner secretion domain-containing protein n=1 Tax=Phenylobacterium sp. TaxID=1871053 RepID=UPI002ED77236
MRGAVAALGLVLAGWPMGGVAQTVIAPDVASDRALGTTVGQMGPVFTIGGGTRVGGNLFHSFARFDLAGGDVARWVRPDAATIANVINRVTGGQASHISGTIDSTALPNATFYFINPAGIVFGPGAQVNVPAAAHFSTATDLRLADGNRFAVATPGGSTLSVAGPEAWGFVGGQGAIDIQGVDLHPEQTTLHFTGAHVSVDDSRFVTRGLDLIGVGDGPATVRLADPLASGAAGRVQVGNSDLSAIELTFGGRSVRIGGGAVDIEGSALTSNGNLFVAASDMLETSGSLFVVSSVTRDAAGVAALRAPLVVLQDTVIKANAIGDGAPGRILVEGDNLLFNRVDIQGDAKDGLGALPGLIQLRANSDVFMLDSRVRSNANGVADGGVVMISGAAVDLRGSTIASDSISLGEAGRIEIAAETLDLTNTFVTSSARAQGGGGFVRVTAADITLKFFSALRSDTSSVGTAGDVVVAAGTLDVQGGSQITSEALEKSTGNAGSVLIDVGRLVMTDGLVSSTSKSIGRGGDVRIFADEVSLDGQNRGSVFIASEALDQGAGGRVFIEAGKVTLDRGAVISSTSFGPAHAGDIGMQVGELSVLRNAIVSSSALGGGDAGDITIVANKILLQSVAGPPPSGISSVGNGGAGGDITLRTGSLVVDGAAVSSDTFAGGDAGAVVINADAITLRNSGSISSSTDGFGDAGSVAIAAKSLTLETGGVILSAATSRSNGDAGEIGITADSVLVGRNASITTATFGRGNAGTVTLAAASLRLDGGLIASSAGLGATGASGEVHISADDLSLLNGGSISTLSVNPKQAGLIEIDAGNLLVDGGRSLINSENQAGNPNFGGQGGPPGPGGDAGTIQIAADNITVSNGGRITTNSFAGAAGDIDIAIARPGLLILEGAEASGVIQTSSGPGTGGKITIRDPLAIISNGGAILALGQQRGANVLIQSRYFINSTDRLNVVDVDGDFQLQTGLYDVSSGTVSRDLSVLDASKVLRGQCPAARSTGAVSQLITRPVGPYARESATDVLGRAQTGGGCP